jgi:hypothetical protein
VEAQRDGGGLSIFVFLLEQMKNHDSQFLGFSTKLKKHKYHSRHSSWFSFLFHRVHTNMEIISRNFYPLFEKSSWPLYSRKKTFIGFLPFRIEISEDTDSRKLWSLWYLLDYGG